MVAVVHPLEVSSPPSPWRSSQAWNRRGRRAHCPARLEHESQALLRHQLTVDDLVVNLSTTTCWLCSLQLRRTWHHILVDLQRALEAPEGCQQRRRIHVAGVEHTRKLVEDGVGATCTCVSTHHSRLDQ